MKRKPNLIAFIKVLRYNVKDYEEGGQILLKIHKITKNWALEEQILKEFNSQKWSIFNEEGPSLSEQVDKSFGGRKTKKILPIELLAERDASLAEVLGKILYHWFSK